MPGVLGEMVPRLGPCVVPKVLAASPPNFNVARAQERFETSEFCETVFPALQ